MLGALAKGKREMSSNFPFTQPRMEEQISNPNLNNLTASNPITDEQLKNIN